MQNMSLNSWGCLLYYAKNLHFLYGILMPEGVIYMIEVIYKDEKQTAKGKEESFNLPKNIRQIGIPKKNTGFILKIMYTLS